MHVLDGSALPISTYLLNGLDRNIHYHHLPISFSARLEKSFEFIDTDYVVLGGDDEFFIPNGLNACISELEAKPELVSCMGRCLRFDHADKTVIGWPDYLVMENYSVSQSNSVDRMVAHMSPYTCSTIYSVVRFPVWRIAFLSFVKREFPVYSLAELQIELAICYQGKSVVLPVLMWLRSSEAPPTRGTDPSLVPENTFMNWWLDPSNDLERAEFLALMGSTLVKPGDIAADVSAGVEKALDVYVQARLNIPTARFTGKLKQRMIRNLPLPLKTILKIIFRPFVKALRFAPMPIMKAAAVLASTGVRVDFKELSKIEAIVAAFHAGAEKTIA